MTPGAPTLLRRLGLGLGAFAVLLVLVAQTPALSTRVCEGGTLSCPPPDGFYLFFIALGLAAAAFVVLAAGWALGRRGRTSGP